MLANIAIYKPQNHIRIITAASLLTFKNTALRAFILLTMAEKWACKA